MWWLPGVFRDVAVQATPAGGLQDVRVEAHCAGRPRRPARRRRHPRRRDRRGRRAVARARPGSRPGSRTTSGRCPVDRRDAVRSSTSSCARTPSGLPPRRVPHDHDRGRAAEGERPPHPHPRREPARAPPRSRPGDPARAGPPRAAADEAAQHQRDPHLPLPAAPGPAGPRGRARLLPDRRVRPGDPRVLPRRLAAQPERRRALGARLPRPDAPHGRAGPEPRERDHLVARQRGGHRAQPRGVARSWSRELDPARPVHYEGDWSSTYVDVYSRMYAHQDEVDAIGRQAEAPLADRGRRRPPPRAAVPPVRVRARDGQRPRRHERVRGELPDVRPHAGRLRVGVARARHPPHHRRTAASSSPTAATSARSSTTATSSRTASSTPTGTRAPGCSTTRRSSSR